MNRRERLIKAVENAIKFKYQPQIPEIFSAVNNERKSRFVELQQQNSRIGRMIILKSALQDENQILNYLDLEEKKRAIDERIVHNEKLSDERIENGEDDEADYAAACQELLQERSDLKMKIEALLKSGETGAILRSLEDAEQRLADVRASVAADKLSKQGTSPQKELQPDNEQKEHDGHNADDSQEPRNGARSLPIEELSLHSRSKRAKQKERADLQEELARKARIAEKEIERAKVSSSRGSSLRSISPVGTPDDNLTKVSGWMDNKEKAENVALLINAPSVQPQTSVSAPVITVRLMHGGQCSAQVGDLKPSVQPTKTTEAVVRDNERDRTKTVKVVVSQTETVQPEVKFATSKLSMTLMTGQSCVPPTNGGNPSSAFQVPQLVNTQKQYLPSQGPNVASNECKR